MLPPAAPPFTLMADLTKINEYYLEVIAPARSNRVINCDKPGLLELFVRYGADNDVCREILALDDDTTFTFSEDQITQD